MQEVGPCRPKEIPSKSHSYSGIHSTSMKIIIWHVFRMKMEKYLELCSIYGLKYVAENMLRVIRFTLQVLFFDSEGRRVGIGRTNSYLLMTFL